MTLPPPDYSGKVRDIYNLDEEKMLMVSSDRISAFDVIFNEKLTGKGEILNQISAAWFSELRRSGLPERHNFKDHLISTNSADFPSPFCNDDYLARRSMLVRKVNRIDFECVVRGYLTGSGWKDYQKSGAICGHRLPENLQLNQQLPEPIFTPATKAEVGLHDENVDRDYMAKKLGGELTQKLEEISIAIFNHASTLLKEIGIILCDTKFEFGLDNDNNLILIDEVLTPDSSRYWKASSYRPGRPAESFDKQIIRDYLEGLDWDKSPPPPPLPTEIIEKTMNRYRQLEENLNRLLGAR